MQENLNLQQHKAIALILQAELTGITNKEIGERVGVSVRTLERWRLKKAFQNELIRQSQKLMYEFLPKVYAELRRLVSNPDVADSDRIKAIRLYLESYGLLKGTRRTTITIEETPEISFYDVLAQLKQR